MLSIVTGGRISTIDAGVESNCAFGQSVLLEGRASAYMQVADSGHMAAMQHAQGHLHAQAKNRGAVINPNHDLAIKAGWGQGKVRLWQQRWCRGKGRNPRQKCTHGSLDCRVEWALARAAWVKGMLDIGKGMGQGPHVAVLIPVHAHRE